ncbi:peptide methionine sulfoxide, partial [Aureobasidium melanogenum]
MKYWRLHQPQTVNLRKIEAGANARTAIMLRSITNYAEFKDLKIFLDATLKGGGSLRLLLPVHWLVSGRPLPSSNLDTLRQHQHILVSLTPCLLLWLSGLVPSRRGRDFRTLVPLEDRSSSAAVRKSSLRLHQRQQSKMSTFWSKLKAFLCCSEEEKPGTVIGEPFDFKRVEVELAGLSEHERSLIRNRPVPATYPLHTDGTQHAARLDRAKAHGRALSESIMSVTTTAIWPIGAKSSSYSALANESTSMTQPLNSEEDIIPNETKELLPCYAGCFYAIATTNTMSNLEQSSTSATTKPLTLILLIALAIATPPIMNSLFARLSRPFTSSTMRFGPEGPGAVSVPEGTEKATVAAGCFWGVEHMYRHHFPKDAVLDARVGYIGGNTDNPSYRAVCTGRTGHAEALQIYYNPDKVSYQKLLEFFYRMHDPTTEDRQGPDVGTQYRSGIFTHNDQQEKIAREVTKKVQEQWWKQGKIATEILPAGEWWDAEAYHQKYLDINPGGYECPSHFLRKFPDLD